MPYHERVSDSWLERKLKLLPLVLAVLSLIVFLVGMSARVTSLEAEEINKTSDIKDINMSLKTIEVQQASLNVQVSDIKNDTDYIKRHIK